jgi:hypothetical protein
MKISNIGNETILCIATRDQGNAMLRELARLGCRVVLLTLDTLRDAPWPSEIVEEIQTMPAGLNQQQIANTVTYLARTRRFARIISLTAADMPTAAALREHMRIPGMGLTTTRSFRDRLAMRAKADKLGIRVPAYCAIFNYDDLRLYMETVPAPWLLLPRCVVSSAEVQQLDDAEQVWRALDVLGDEQSNFLLEQALPGDVFLTTEIVADGKVVFATDSDHTGEALELKSIPARLIPALGMVRGVTQTKFLRSHASGKMYFLETVAEAADESLADIVERGGVSFGVEWARVEVASMRGESYRLP